MFDLEELKTKLALLDFYPEYSPSDDSTCLRIEVIHNVEVEFTIMYNSERTYYREATRLQPEEMDYKFEPYAIEDVLIYIKEEDDSFDVHDNEEDYFEIEDVLNIKFKL